MDGQIRDDGALRPAPSRRTIGAALELPVTLARLALGVDRQLWCGLGRAEQVAILSCALAAALGATIVFVAVNVGLDQAMGARIETTARTLVSGLVALVVLNFDCGFIRKAIDRSGRQQAYDAGMLDAGPRDRLGRLMVYRASQSLVFSFVVVVTLLLELFADDVTQTLTEEARARNAPLIAKYEAMALAHEQGMRADLEIAIKDVAALKAGIFAADSFENPFAPDLESARERLRRATAERATAQTNAGEYLRLASAECEGVTVAGASGRRGCGPQFRFFTAEAERAQAVVDASAAEIVKLEVQIERLRAASDAAIAENAATAASRRSAGRDDLARLEARSSELRAGLTSFTDDENEWVRRQLEGDLLYAPAAATLSAKLGALTQVFTKAPLILAFAVALKLLIAMLDMSATVQHLLGAPPRFTGYSQWAADARRRIQLEGELRPNVMKAAAARLDSMKQWHELNLERDAASLADHVRGRWREAVSEHDK